MAKITFMGAGSTVFAKSIIGDSMCSPVLHDAHIALYDIDPVRLEESKLMLDTLNANINAGRAKITAHLGVENRRKALSGANYVVNAIQVGGYKPSTVIDFEIPKKFGLRQTIADTLGIGGIFRALRTIPVMFDFARDMEKVCPDAWMLSYTNPAAMLSAAMNRGTSIRTVALCHSVQGCANDILRQLGMGNKVKKLQWKIAGINHQAWLLEVTDDGKDLYPEIKARAAGMLEQARKKGAMKHGDMVRQYLMLKLGYYITESSEHNAEYMPYFIKARFPELIEEFNIPLDEYPRRCIGQIEGWKTQRDDIVRNKKLSHTRGGEFGSYIMEAMETDKPTRIHGNIMNTGLITNLPAKACVEVPCLVDRNGVQGCYVGDLPEQCAAINRTNINPQILTVEAALTLQRDYIYQAAMLDPHTSAELTVDQIHDLCDALIEAHGKMLPTYKATVIKPIKPDNPIILPPSIPTWRILGPFENADSNGENLGLTQALPPESGVVLKAKYTGKNGDTIAWKHIKKSDQRQDGFVDLCKLTHQVDNAVAYAWTTIESAKARKVTLLLGSDDGVAVWLNGKKLLAVEAARAAAPAQETLRLSLKKGRNELLLKIDQKNGGWGFYAHMAQKGLKIVS